MLTDRDVPLAAGSDHTTRFLEHPHLPRIVPRPMTGRRPRTARLLPKLLSAQLDASGLSSGGCLAQAKRYLGKP